MSSVFYGDRGSVPKGAPNKSSHDRGANNLGIREYSPRIAALAEVSANFCGLPKGVSQYDILGLLEFAGGYFGLKAHHLRYLAHIIKFTRDQDWTSDACHPPVVWQAVTSIAIDLGRDERSIRRIENELHDLGILTWSDSGNHKRYGVRDHRGFIKYGYGVDLSPLAALYDDLEIAASEIRERRRLWREEKRSLSSLKRRVLAKYHFMDLSVDEIEELPCPVATTSLEEIRTQYAELVALEMAVDNALRLQSSDIDDEETEKDQNSIKSMCKDSQMSARADSYVRHIQTTTKPNSSKEDTCNLVDNTKMSSLRSQEVGHLLANAHTDNGLAKKPVVKSGLCKKKEASEKPKDRKGGDNSSSGVSQKSAYRQLNSENKALKPCFNKDLSSDFTSDANSGDLNRGDTKPGISSLSAGKPGTGIEHISLKNLLSAASEEFRDHIPIHDRAIAPADFVHAAGMMCHELGINRHAWLEAIAEIGRLPAAVCVLIADKNQYNSDNPVRNPGGFLRGMIAAAKDGELQLHRSIFGILEREKYDA